MNLILTAYNEIDERILVNWNNVCYAEPRGEDGEDLHARIHFNVTSATGALNVEVVEDIDDIASMLESEGESVVEIEDEEEASTDEVEEER